MPAHVASVSDQRDEQDDQSKSDLGSACQAGRVDKVMRDEPATVSALAAPPEQVVLQRSERAGKPDQFHKSEHVALRDNCAGAAPDRRRALAAPAAQAVTGRGDRSGSSLALEKVAPTGLGWATSTGW